MKRGTLPLLLVRVGLGVSRAVLNLSIGDDRRFSSRLPGEECQRRNKSHQAQNVQRAGSLDI